MSEDPVSLADTWTTERGGWWEWADDSLGFGEETRAAVHRDGPAGAVPPDTRPLGVDVEPGTLRWVECPPGSYWMANLGWDDHARPISGCFPPPCPRPQGYHFPEWMDGLCAERPLGWTPGWVPAGAEAAKRPPPPSGGPSAPVARPPSPGGGSGGPGGAVPAPSDPPPSLSGNEGVVSPPGVSPDAIPEGIPATEGDLEMEVVIDRPEPQPATNERACCCRCACDEPSRTPQGDDEPVGEQLEAPPDTWRTERPGWWEWADDGSGFGGEPRPIVYRDGPAGAVAADTRLPPDTRPPGPGSLTFVECPPGSYWMANLGWDDHARPISGCFPPPCPRPAGYHFPDWMEGLCAERPPGWTPGWAPADGGPVAASPSIPPGGFAPERDADRDRPENFGYSKYPLAPPPNSTFPNAPDYLYIDIPNPAPIQSAIPPFIPESPVGYTLVRYFSGGLYHDLELTDPFPGPIPSFIFQYIDSRLLQNQQGQQAPTPAPPRPSEPTEDSPADDDPKYPALPDQSDPRVPEIPAPIFADWEWNERTRQRQFTSCGIVDEKDPRTGLYFRPEREPRFQGPLHEAQYREVCGARKSDFKSGFDTYRAWTHARKPAEYRGGLHNQTSGTCRPIDVEVLAFMYNLSFLAGYDAWPAKDDWPEFSATIRHYFWGLGVDLQLPIDKLIREVPRFAVEADRMVAAAQHWAVRKYKKGYRRYVLTGPFGLYVIPTQCSKNWFGSLDAFVYWYVACVSVSGGGVHGEPVWLDIDFQLNVADHYEFQRTPRIDKLRKQTRIPAGDTGDGGDLITIERELEAMIEEGQMLPEGHPFRVYFPPSLMLVNSDGSVDAPPYITTKRFLSLHRCGLANEYNTFGSWSPPQKLRVRTS